MKGKIKLERYGTWYGAPVYKVERDSTAFWITDEGYLVFGNKIRQTIG